jgi:hypothetical protein
MHVVSALCANVAELKTTNRELNRRLAIYQPAANEHVYQPHGSEGGGGDGAGREGSDQHDDVGGGTLVSGASGSGSGGEGMGEDGCANCQSAISDVEMLTDYISTLKAEIVIIKDRSEEAVGSPTRNFWVCFVVVRGSSCPSQSFVRIAGLLAWLVQGVRRGI